MGLETQRRQLVSRQVCPRHSICLRDLGEMCRRSAWPDVADPEVACAPVSVTRRPGGSAWQARDLSDAITLSFDSLPSPAPTPPTAGAGGHPSLTSTRWLLRTPDTCNNCRCAPSHCRIRGREGRRLGFGRCCVRAGRRVPWPACDPPGLRPRRHSP